MLRRQEGEGWPISKVGPDELWERIPFRQECVVGRQVPSLYFFPYGYPCVRGSHTRSHASPMAHPFLQCGTAKDNKFTSTGTRFFWGESDIKIVIRGAKYIEKHPSCIFPMLFVFGCNFFLENFYIMPY